MTFQCDALIVICIETNQELARWPRRYNVLSTKSDYDLSSVPEIRMVGEWSFGLYMCSAHTNKINLKILFLFPVHKCFACMCICVLCTYLVPMTARRRHLIPGKTRIIDRCELACGIKPMSSERAANAVVNC